MALLITVENKWEIIELNDDLTLMQKLVSGYIELVPLHGGVIIDGIKYTGMIINEEGKIKGLPVNEMATGFYNSDGVHDSIMGNAILFSDGELSED